MESAENDKSVSRTSHKTLKIDDADFHISPHDHDEQSFHLKTEKLCPNYRSHRIAAVLSPAATLFQTEPLPSGASAL